MNRRGFTLPVALLTMALMGALAGAVMLIARLRWQSGQRSLEAFQARMAAESEVERLRAAWDPLRADSVAIGSIVAVPSAISGRGIAAYDSLIRLGHGLFLIRSAGIRSTADGAVLAREEAAGLVRLLAPRLPDSIAVVATAPVDVVGTGLVDGDDQVPAGWNGLCTVPGPPGIAVMAAPGTPIHALCGGGACIHGSPAIAVDSAQTNLALAQLGPATLADLVGHADHRVGGTLASIQPAVSGGSCVQGDSLNWGDPASVSTPCSGYFPVIAAAPATRILSGQGQGVLVATGPLELSGNASFTGVVIARGAIVVRNQARITGLLVALDSALVEDAAVIERSRCAIGRALRGAARPSNRVERSWFRWD
jgi:hypothetical protein